MTFEDLGKTTTSAIDDRTVFRRVSSPGLEWVEVGGEVVAWTEANESLHLFDSISSLLFQLMDGEATVGETVRDLRELFTEDESVVRGDVLICLSSLEDLGALERVR